MAAAATRRYAQDTTVSADDSQLEIKRLLMKHGATGFINGFEGDDHALQFCLKDRRVQIRVTMPRPDQFGRSPGGISRNSDQREKACEQAIKQRWRAMYLIIRAKLEAVESGITTLEDAFLADMLVPTAAGVRRLGDVMQGQIARAYELGEMPSMLALPAARENQP